MLEFFRYFNKVRAVFIEFIHIFRIYFGNQFTLFNFYFLIFYFSVGVAYISIDKFLNFDFLCLNNVLVFAFEIIPVCFTILLYTLFTWYFFLLLMVNSPAFISTGLLGWEWWPGAIFAFIFRCDSIMFIYSHIVFIEIQSYMLFAR